MNDKERAAKKQEIKSALQERAIHELLEVCIHEFIHIAHKQTIHRADPSLTDHDRCLS